MGDDNRRLWADWVAAQVGGDPVRQRTALDAALQAMAVGRSPAEAADAARAAAGPIAQGPVRCRFCGSVPAVTMTVYEHNGYVVLMTFKNIKGPFCRSCGLYVWRRMTDQTLLRGWLGLFSFFIAPATALVNVVNRRKLASLAPPEPGSGARPPANPGGGLFHRPGVYVYLGVIVFVLVAFGLPALLR